VERLAMAAVMAQECRSGRLPVDVSAQNLGYDIESRDPATDRVHLIEVKGRVHDADTVSITRNEMLVALNKRESYSLAVVFIQNGVAAEPIYVRDPVDRMVSGDPLFGVVSVTLNLGELLAERAT
ncbi:MAG: DUF3883 domain-containing protein, partial [Dehalococcoidia bacterium]